MATPKKYRTDKTAFKTQTFEEADNHYGPWEDKSTGERLDAACYLICMAFQVKPSTKWDRTIFSNVNMADYFNEDSKEKVISVAILINTRPKADNCHRDGMYTLAKAIAESSVAWPPYDLF